MRRAALLALALAALLGAGGDALGRLLLRVGLPAPALFTDPLWRGAALYRAGRWDEADAAFAEAGMRATFQRGLSLARTGAYQLSAAYFDAALYADPEDREARENRALVGALFNPVVGTSEIAYGESVFGTRVDGREDEAGRATEQGDQHENRWAALNPGHTERRAAADAAWLDAIEDAPMRYLAARLRAEQIRRFDMGLGAPPAENSQ